MIKNYDQNRNLGHYFNLYLGNFYASHGILFLEDRIVLPPQLRAPVRRRLHQGQTGMFKMKQTSVSSGHK